MDQTRKRKVNRRSGFSQSKVARVEEIGSVVDSDGAACSSNIRASSPAKENTENPLVIMDDDEEVSRLVVRKKGLRRKKESMAEAQHGQMEDEIDRSLDQELENKSRQHNLTSANVRSIIHEVITNEHVVAMMKAAISETEPIPVFEPKMTRSKLKEVVEKGVVIPTWNISPIKKPTDVKKGPQFVDIPLEEEDSSDEEYRPDEDEDDETTEETLLESDLDISSSSPRGCQSHRRSRHLTVTATPMGPPAPPPAPSRVPPECSFLEKLHAVDEELAFGPDCMEPYQSLSGANGDESLISFRTRSKRPLRNIPLGRLEAELRAPDITPDMYEFATTAEDRDWTHWLQGLMSSDMENEEEGDDEDDPEYNFLADIDEPDVEDYRNDKAVRISKKELNGLMEELFDTFRDDLVGQDEEEEDKEDEQVPLPEVPDNQNTVHKDLLADVLRQRFRTVREHLSALKQQKCLLQSKGVSVPASCPPRPSSPEPTALNNSQKLQLQQQMQQHVQLLTQVNMLSSFVSGLEMEAFTTKQFLLELQMFARNGEQTLGPAVNSVFSVCNLQEAISLMEGIEQSPKTESAGPWPCFSGSGFPAHLAWLMATRPVFIYPELLPVAPLCPSTCKAKFTPAEDCLAVLGHKHLRCTIRPLQLTCRYLLAAKSLSALKAHIRDQCLKSSPTIIKTYFLEGKNPSMPLFCKRVHPSDRRPPVEKDPSCLPKWMSKNLTLFYKHGTQLNPLPDSSQSRPSCTDKKHSNLLQVTSFPHSLPEKLAQVLKLSHRRKKSNTKPEKPAPSTDAINQALRHLPNILPKTAAPPNNLMVNPGTALNNGALSGHLGVVKIASIPQVQHQSESNCATSIGSLETPGFNSPLGAPQAQILISVPATQFNSCPSEGTRLNPIGHLAEGNQGELIIALPHTTAFLEMNSGPVVFTKKCVGQTFSLLKLLPKPSGLVSTENAPKPGNRFPLPSDRVNSTNNVKRQAYKRLAPKTSQPLICRTNRRPDGLNTNDGLQTEPRVTQETFIDSLRETGLKEDEFDEDDREARMNEAEELVEEDYTELLLTLSESSGSPMSNREEEDSDMEDLVAVDNHREKPLTKHTLGSDEQTEAEASRDRVSERQEAVKNLSKTDTETTCEQKGNVHNDDKCTPNVSDDHCRDPPDDLYRDDTDAALAQAYLEKVKSAFQAMPGKMEKVLCVLSEFEKDPERHTSLDLLRRLKPLLQDFPELLQDFAAFLHPDQAKECGLFAEQQTFERSRRFLHQLKEAFGEKSTVHRSIVHLLQEPSVHGHVDLKEKEARLTLLFRGHPRLLEEFWVLFKQLHPDERTESCADEVPLERTGGSSRSSDRRAKPVQSIFKHKRRKVQCAKAKTRSEVRADGGSSSSDQGQDSSGSSARDRNTSCGSPERRVLLWTREADRVILTTCQQRGAKPDTFHAIAAQLGNTTASQVFGRFQDLVLLFHRSIK